MYAIVLLLLLGAEPETPAASTRPTAEDVADAVRASRGKNLPTKEDHTRRLNKLLQAAEYERDHPPAGPPRSQRRWIAARKQQIVQLKQEIRDAEKSWKQPDLDSVELSKMEWESMAVGDVGRATLRGARYSYRCLQILGPESSLITVIALQSVRRSSPRPGQLLNRTEASDLTVVHLDRYGTDTMQEGLAVDLECDVVVVGRFTYTAADGAKRTVFSIEEFNPNQPFE